MHTIDAHFEETYRELRKMARLRLRAGRPDTLIDTTALVHESYLRLAASGQLQLENRAHFLGYAGQAMRSVIVDLVRKRQSCRHGAAASRVSLNLEVIDVTPRGEDEILRVHEALQDLARLDLRMVRIVEMRYFAGMTEAEIAEALSITDRTVRREWEKARLWLAQILT